MGTRRARDSRPCLVKDAAAIIRQKGQAGGRVFLFPIQVRPEGRPAYPVKQKELINQQVLGMEEWRCTKGTRLLS